MKKKILLGVAVGMSLSTIAFAAPLENYDAGKAEVNIGTSALPAMSIGGDGANTTTSGVKHRIYGGATVGLGHKLALQYRYTDSQMKPNEEEVNFRTQEYNLRYKVDKNVSIYAGEMHARLGLTGPDSGEISRNIFQVGAQYQAPISKRLVGWGAMGFGSNMQHYEAGIGYKVADNLDLDLMYQYTEVKDFKTDVGSDAVTSKGLYAGLSFKF